MSTPKALFPSPTLRDGKGRSHSKAPLPQLLFLPRGRCQVSARAARGARVAPPPRAGTDPNTSRGRQTEARSHRVEGGERGIPRRARAAGVQCSAREKNVGGRVADGRQAAGGLRLLVPADPRPQPSLTRGRGLARSPSLTLRHSPSYSPRRACQCYYDVSS